MSKVKQAEQLVAQLSPVELADFRRWFADFDGDNWDRQVEADAANGKLDGFAERALAAHAAGRTKKF